MITMSSSAELSPSRNIVLPIFLYPYFKLYHQPFSFLNSLRPSILRQFGIRNFSHDLPKTILTVGVIKFIVPFSFMRWEGAEDEGSHPPNRIIPVRMMFLCSHLIHLHGPS